tara:strand:- start:30 stop:920 length:891 start_codon:yes stop_codon:yes gene_type:complete
MLFISSTFFKDKTSFREASKICESNGIFNIEIGSNHSYEDDYTYIKKLKKFNFIVHNYFPIPRENFVVNIASLDDNIREKSLLHIQNSINFCHEVGAQLYTFHPGFITDPNGESLSKKNYDFNWTQSELSNSNYSLSFDNMKQSMEQIIKYAEKENIKIAFETEGSFNQKDHLLMQRPEEYENILDHFSVNEIGVSLNIGHLILASNAFGFEIDKFVNLISSHIVAMELSHNNGIEDEHLPLVSSGWYWNLIFDKRFNNIYKVLEFRNTNITTVLNTINLFETEKSKYEKRDNKEN